MGKRPHAGCRRGSKGPCRYLDRPCTSLVRLRRSSPPTIAVDAESTPCPCRASTPCGPLPGRHPLRPAAPPRRVSLPGLHALRACQAGRPSALCCAGATITPALGRTGGDCRRPAASNDHKSRSVRLVGGTARPVVPPVARTPLFAAGTHPSPSPAPFSPPAPARRRPPVPFSPSAPARPPARTRPRRARPNPFSRAPPPASHRAARRAR
jgi:hypothetical protein